MAQFNFFKPYLYIFNYFNFKWFGDFMFLLLIS